MTRRTILVALLAVASVAAFAGEAMADAWTVYKFNTRRPEEGLVRVGATYLSAGVVHSQLYTTEAKCKAGIEARIRDNKRNKQDFEDFAILKHRKSPDAGVFTGKDYTGTGYWYYRPSGGRRR